MLGHDVFDQSVVSSKGDAHPLHVAQPATCAGLDIGQEKGDGAARQCLRLGGVVSATLPLHALTVASTAVMHSTAQEDELRDDDRMLGTESNKLMARVKGNSIRYR